MKKTNLDICLDFLNWQGGTIHQVSAALGIPVEEILKSKDIEKPSPSPKVDDCNGNAFFLLWGYGFKVEYNTGTNELIQVTPCNGKEFMIVGIPDPIKVPSKQFCLEMEKYINRTLENID